MADTGPLFAKVPSVAKRADAGPLGFTAARDGAGRKLTTRDGLTCDDWENQAFNMLGNVDIVRARWGQGRGAARWALGA